MAQHRLTARGSVWFSKEDGKTCIEGSFIAEGRCVKNWFELGEVSGIAVSKFDRGEAIEDKFLRRIDIGVVYFIRGPVLCLWK